VVPKSIPKTLAIKSNPFLVEASTSRALQHNVSQRCSDSDKLLKINA
jgi:hypothetical protein